MLSLDLKPLWHSLSTDQKNIVASRLLDSLEVSDRKKRMNAARCVLYLLQVSILTFFYFCYITWFIITVVTHSFNYIFQGCWAECQSDKEQQTNAKENVLFLYTYGVYNIFLNLLNVEIEYEKYI